MTRNVLLFVLLLSGSVWAANYNVVKRDAAGLSLDGAVNEAVWDGVPSLNGSFQYPWENVEAPATVFKAFHDGTNFYFSFVCADSQVLVKKAFAGERATVDVEDRVELFFAPGPINQPLAGTLPTYYNVEVDAAGRIHDYSMVFYRAAMDSDWNMPGLKSAGKQTPAGYSVEVSIPLASFRSLNLLTGAKADTLIAGAFRAEFSGSVDDPDNIQMRWISWVDPATAEPDFHVASAFGTFTLLP